MDKIEIPSTKKSFVINSEHADLIVNDLLQGDFEALGRLFTDLVNFNVNGDLALAETKAEDKAERTARRLFKIDSENYIKHYCKVSEQNAKNRTAEQQPNRDEILDYARSKGYIRDLADEQVVVSWAMTQAQNDWKDRDGNPIKYWKRTLDSYMLAVMRNKTKDMFR